jgi:hypothetical protein
LGGIVGVKGRKDEVTGFPAKIRAKLIVEMRSFEVIAAILPVVILSFPSIK